MFVLAWIIGIHLVEANFLNPKIMGDAAKIHPVLVVFALIAGEHSYGLVGALFAVPVASIIQTIFVYYRKRPTPRPRPSTPAAIASRGQNASAVAALPRGRRARTRRQRVLTASEMRAAGRRPTISAERSGTSCQPGRGGDVAVRLDDQRAQRLVRDAAPVALGSLRSLAAWQTGQSEMPSISR